METAETGLTMSAAMKSARYVQRAICPMKILRTIDMLRIVSLRVHYALWGGMPQYVHRTVIDVLRGNMMTQNTFHAGGTAAVQLTCVKPAL